MWCWRWRWWCGDGGRLGGVVVMGGGGWGGNGNVGGCGVYGEEKESGKKKG